MRWLICLIPLFLACSDPLGPGPLRGSFEGKNAGVFNKSAITIKDISTWDITILFSPPGSGRLNWGAKLQNNSRTTTYPLEMNIALFPDSLRTPGTALVNISNRNFDLIPLEQEAIVHIDQTSLTSDPVEFYWTLSWGER
jgi:hypothetical protein